MEQLSYRELQALAKQYKIKANQKRDALLASITEAIQKQREEQLLEQVLHEEPSKVDSAVWGADENVEFANVQFEMNKKSPSPNKKNNNNNNNEMEEGDNIVGPASPRGLKLTKRGRIDFDAFKSSIAMKSDIPIPEMKKGRVDVRYRK